MSFATVSNRYVQADFEGGDVTSDGGSLLLRAADRMLGLTTRVARGLKDTRRRASTFHSTLSLLRQRIYGLALGYEDLNDHHDLRRDPGFQTAVGRDTSLASSPTLCRFENRAHRATAWLIHQVLFEQFVAAHKHAPRELILDFDATDDPTHGMQEGRFFHGFYDHYCFLPLYVFCGQHLLVSYLRRSNIDAAKHSWAILALLVKQLRAVWPKVKIIVRADSGFCRHRMLRWCERHNVGYIIGIAKNNRLNTLSNPLHEQARLGFERAGKTQRLFGEISYAADTWKKPHRVIVKAEHNAFGANPRYVVTNFDGDPKQLYENVYCGRGDMENRIKEQQLYLFADRTSAHRWWANQFRLLLSGLAYTLVATIRRIGLRGTALARAQCATIRLRLLKIGAVVVRNTRRVYIHLSSACPHKQLFRAVHARLVAG